MNLRMGGQDFVNIEVPLLWGSRAILQDADGRVAVIDLSQSEARLEVVGDEPAPGVEFRPATNGFVVASAGRDLYSYDKSKRELASISLGLPPVRIESNALIVGGNRFVGNRVSGFGVGVAVTPTGISIGSPLPAGLARLRV